MPHCAVESRRSAAEGLAWHESEEMMRLVSNRAAACAVSAVLWLTTSSFGQNANPQAGALFAAQQVQFGRNGTTLGAYVRTWTGGWNETNAQGETTFSFAEVSRDATSVSFEDRSRRVRIRIDLATSKIFYSVPGTSPVALYDVLGSSSAPAYSPQTVASPDPQTYYFLQTRASELEGTCLEANRPGAASAMGGASFMDRCSLKSGQLWAFVSLAARGAPGYYQLTTLGQKEQSLCLESEASATDPRVGSGVHMAPCGVTPPAGQIWRLLPVGNAVKLQSKARESTNQCLEGNRVAPGSVLAGVSFMAACVDVTGEAWLLVRQSEFGSIRDGSPASPPVEAHALNGLTVEQLDFGHNGRATGSFFRVGTEWKERDVKGAVRFTFAEVNRDQWSVHLRDTSRGIDLQLDLHRKKVVYSDTRQRFDLYDLLRWASVTGYTAQQVSFGANASPSGGYFQTTATTWKEVDRGGSTRFTFAETARDDWSVFLEDRSRNVSIQLDLHRRKVRYRENGGSWRDLYDIVSSATVTGRTAQQAMFGRRFDRLGRLAQTAAGQWRETDAQGRIVASFQETGRDDWSVFLRDGTRNVVLQLDLYRRKIVYSDPTRSRVDLYDVLRSSVVGSVAMFENTDLERLGFVGSSKSYDVTALREALASQGYVLVKSTTLEPKQCVLMYEETSRREVKADGGVLYCSAPLNGGGSRVEVRAFYGGCDVVDPERGQGVGSVCEAALINSDIRVKVGDGVYTRISGTGVGVSECAAMSAERTCASIGADLVDVGFRVESERGSGIGLSGGVGVGGGINGGYDDGLLSVGVCGKAVVGGCIDFALNVEEVTEVVRLGESAYFESKGAIVAVGSDFTRQLATGAKSAVNASGQVIMTLQNAGQSVAVFAEDVGQGTTDTYAQARDALRTAQTILSAGRVVTGVAASTQRVFSFLGL